MSSDDAASGAVHGEDGRTADRGDLPGSDGEHALQERLGTTERADAFYDTAMQSALTDRMRSFLAERWLGVVGSVDDGLPRVAPAVGGPGVIQVLDPGTVAWPASRMVGEAPTFGCPGAERWLSLVTVDWWDATVGLHVNGVGERVEDLSGWSDASRPGGDGDPLAACEEDPFPGSDWIVLSVEEAYVHCAKHVPQLSVVRPPPSPAAVDPISEPYTHLSDRARRFVGSRLQAFLATADAEGETDVSPRFGPSGFVQVRDESTLAWPEYRGNGVHASLGNVSERPRASLLFVDWWSAEAVLEVGGDVSLADDVAWAEDRTDVDRTKTWVVLDVRSVDLVENPRLPRLAVEAFDPPWGTDDAEAKRSGFFTD